MSEIKRFVKYLTVLFLVGGLTVLFSQQVSASSSLLVSRGFIDNPSANSTIQNVYNVRGWFLDESGVSKVEILVDGKVIGNAAYGQARPDVYNAYPQYKNSNSGYQFSLNTKQLTNGTHQLSVRETGGNGAQTTISRTVTVNNLPARGIIDNPSANSTIQNTYNVRGWFLDGTGVSKVEVLMDGKVMGNAIYGQSRPDVYQAYPQYTNSTSGYQFSLNTKQLTNGTHQLSVRETGGNGAQTTISRTVTVNNLPARGIIDSPSANSTMQDTYNVRGWFLDGTGVSKVEVLVDGKVMGNATYGQPRPDVYQAYPQYNNSTSGYQFSLSTKQLTNGTHQLLVRETGGNSAQTTTSRTVTVNNLPAQGIIDNPGQGSTLKGITNVYGWFLDGSGISKVEVYVDGKDQGTATYGLSRPDVYNAYPQYNNSDSGYQFYLKSYLFSAGSHTLTVKGIGTNGEQTVINRTIQVGQLPGGALQEGIDVSNNNGSINFQAVRDSGVSFVIAKASEGTTFADPTFTNNLTEATAAGLTISAYHYLDYNSLNSATTSNSMSEADQFAKVLKNAKFSGYAFVDVEIPYGDPVPSSATLLNNVTAFLNKLETDGITKIGIYSNLSFFQSYLNLSVLKNDYPSLLVWTAAWHPADQGPGTTTDLWQFTDSGSVNGVSGSVDMDLSYNPIF